MLAVKLRYPAAMIEMALREQVARANADLTGPVW
jgi:hypothetical protein